MRLSAVLPALLLTAGLVAVPPVVTVSAQVSAPASAEVVGASSSIAWVPCRDSWLASQGLECGSLQVPLDHARPSGERIQLALTRRPHTSADEDYRGVMLTNPGGPGGSGLLLPGLAERVPDGVGEAYDWIGMDPRGVGSSSPSLHCDSRHFGTNRPSYVPRTRGIERHWRAKSARYARSCADTSAKRRLLAHLSTLATVRDMELLRAALGAETLNYYGFSYGSYLGQVYAWQYPARVGRFVLDGVVDPRRTWYAAALDQDRAFDANLNRFFGYLAAHPGHFGLGRDTAAIRRGYYRLLERLDRRPAAGGRLGPSELADALVEVGYYVYGWDELGRAYARLVRQGDGAELLDRYRQAHMGDDNGFAIYNAVQCTDAPWPGWQRTRKDSRALHRRAPFLTWNNTWYNAPCLTWAAPARQRLAVSGARVTSKILLISETGDAATPYAGALSVRRIFPSASLVAGIGGTTHSSSLSGVACVDDSVADFLRSGLVPTRLAGNGPDRRCPAVQPPSPGSSRASARAATGDRMSPILRQALTDAQRTGR